MTAHSRRSMVNNRRYSIQRLPTVSTPLSQNDSSPIRFYTEEKKFVTMLMCYTKLVKIVVFEVGFVYLRNYEQLLFGVRQSPYAKLPTKTQRFSHSERAILKCSSALHAA